MAATQTGTKAPTKAPKPTKSKTDRSQTLAPPGDGAAKPKAPRPATKAEVIEAIAEKTKLAKQDVSKALAALTDLVGKHLGKKGPGAFVMPGLLKLKVVRRAATKAKQGINPFTKEPMTIKARPARNVVRAMPLKALKELV